MSSAASSAATVIAATTIRVPAAGHEPGAVIALVAVDGGRRLVRLARDPESMPAPGDVIALS